MAVQDSNALAATITHLCKPSREQSLALTKAEEAMMWANAAIAREGVNLDGEGG